MISDVFSGRFPARRRFSIGIPDVSGRNSGCHDASTTDPGPAGHDASTTDPGPAGHDASTTDQPSTLDRPPGANKNKSGNFVPRVPRIFMCLMCRESSCASCAANLHVPHVPRIFAVEQESLRR